MSLAAAMIATFSPLRGRNFRIYMSGQTVSMTGNYMQMTGQGWVVWELTHSAAALGVVAMLAALPTLVLGPWLGVLADRLDRRRLLMGTSLVAAALAGTMAALVQTGFVQIWHIYMLATLLGVVAALDAPTQNAFVGDLTGVAELHGAFSVYAIGIQISRMVGPTLAGWVIAAAGTATTFWLNGLSYMVVLFSLTVLQSRQARLVATGSPLREFGDGLAFMQRAPRITDLVVLSGVVVLFGFANLQMFPAFAAVALGGGPRELGLLTGAFGAGALVSTLVVVPACQQVRRTGLLLTASAAWGGAWFVVFALTSSLAPAMAALFLGAFGQPVVFINAKALIQRLSPPTMWGRLLTVLMMATTGLQPIVSLIIGFVAQALGAPVAIGANGAVLVAMTAVMIVFRKGLYGWEPTAGSHSADTTT